MFRLLLLLLLFADACWRVNNLFVNQQTVELLGNKNVSTYHEVTNHCSGLHSTRLQLHFVRYWPKFRNSATLQNSFVHAVVSKFVSWSSGNRLSAATQFNTVFRYFVTGSDHSGWDHVAGESATPLYYCRRSLSAQSSVIAFMLYGMRFFSHLMCFVLTKCWCFSKSAVSWWGMLLWPGAILVRTFETLRSAVTFISVSIFPVSLHRCPTVSEMQILWHRRRHKRRLTNAHASFQNSLTAQSCIVIVISVSPHARHVAVTVCRKWND